jgi:hypothetical protein
MITDEIRREFARAVLHDLQLAELSCINAEKKGEEPGYLAYQTMLLACAVEFNLVVKEMLY